MMWELIRANKRRSTVLVLLMGLLLIGLGYAFGAALFFPGGMPVDTPQAVLWLNPAGGMTGALFAGALWLVQVIIAFAFGDRILMAVSGAREIQKSDHPQLFNVVEEMTIASSLGKMPRVFIIDDPGLNAFAAGRSKDNACVAVTAGLLGKLNRDELQGVVAHEIAHIVHRDVLYMTMVGIMLGTIVMISEVALRSMRFATIGGGSGRNSGGRGKNNGAAIMLIIALVLAILAPILAQLIYFALSRRREYLADAGAAVYTRYPNGLASALEQISSDPQPLARANRATAPMYIINPLQKARGLSAGLMSTHPPTEKRVTLLRSLGGGVSYAEYQQAWARQDGRSAKMPASALKDRTAQPLRAPHPDFGDGGGNTPRERMRQAGDALRNVNQFLFLACACGMRVKLPPDFKQDHVACPRCHANLQVPMAGLAATAMIGEQLSQQAAAPVPPPIPMARVRPGEPPLQVTRPASGWTTIRCACGATKNLAPTFALPKTTCTSCGREIQVR
jgi:heat shock protein HtpX